MAAVQAETVAALVTQSPLSAQDVAASPVLLSAPQPGHMNFGQQESEKTLTLQEFNRQQNGGVIAAPPAAIAAPAVAIPAGAAPTVAAPAVAAPQQPLVPAPPQVGATPSPASGNNGGVNVPGVVSEVRPAPVVGPSLTPTTPVVPTTPIGNPDSTLGGGSGPAVTNTQPPAQATNTQPPAQVVTPPPAVQQVAAPPPAAQQVAAPPPAAQQVAAPPPAAQQVAAPLPAVQQVVTPPPAAVVVTPPPAAVVTPPPAAVVTPPPAAVVTPPPAAAVTPPPAAQVTTTPTPTDSNDRPDPTISNSR
jgi:hypothetical protein